MAIIQQGDKTEIKLGTCRVYYDGTDLGYTKGGVMFRMIPNTYDVTVDDLGDNVPLKIYDMGYNVEVDVPLAQHTLALLKIAVPVLNTAGSTETYGGSIGDEIVGKELILDPIYATRGLKCTLYKAVPQSNIEFSYVNTAEKIIMVTFRGTPDDTRTDGDWTVKFEDPVS